MRSARQNRRRSAHSRKRWYGFDGMLAMFQHYVDILRSVEDGTSPEVYPRRKVKP